ncbi:MAG: 1-acyl-sn-glycerol-3-phosphate acyltransferase [Bacteroidota bacterium]
MKRKIYQFLFKFFGWKISNAPDLNRFQYVLIAAPHSSNWDFFIGLAVKNILEIHPRFFAKKELFFFPFNIFLKAIGGIPVDRRSKHDLVSEVSQQFTHNPTFSLALAPEGTRKAVPKFKTGFYQIAVQAKVPIIMVGLDYQKKVVSFADPLYPTGDLNEDSKIMAEFYKDKIGKYRNVGSII